MITEKEYLKSLQIVIDYRNQVVKQVESIETYKKQLKDIVIDRFILDENFNRTNLANELKASRGYICRVIREYKKTKNK